MQRIFLIGPPGAGKTETGKQLASLLSCDFFDIDQLIENSQAMTVAEIFELHGESHFRKLESDELQKLKANPPQSDQVFATGAGLPAYGDNFDELSALGDVVALHADVSVLSRRLSGDTKRPLLANRASTCSTPLAANDLEQRLAKLVEARQSVYSRARYRIDTSALSPDQVARAIIEALSGNENK